MSAEVLQMPVKLQLRKPELDDFYSMSDYEKYSTSIWYCIHEVMQKDAAMLGQYGETYDEKLLARLDATRQLIMSFRRYGMIAVNQEVQKSISNLLQDLGV